MKPLTPQEYYRIVQPSYECYRCGETSSLNKTSEGYLCNSCYEHEKQNWPDLYSIN